MATARALLSEGGLSRLYRGIGYAMVGFGLLIGAGFLRLRSLKDTETGYTLLA